MNPAGQAPLSRPERYAVYIRTDGAFVQHDVYDLYEESEATDVGDVVRRVEVDAVPAGRHYVMSSVFSD
jgi:hypothetical protein